MATYTLADGTRKTQLTISGDTTVVFPTKLDYFGVRSLDGANILVSKIKVPTILEDGVYSTDEGDGDVVVDDGVFTDTLYLKGSGTVVVYGGAKPNHLPFKVGGKGGGGSGGDNTRYKGTTTTAISNGSTTNPITIDGKSYTAVFGDIVVYDYTEFVFDGTTWSEFGRPFDTTPTSGSANAVTSDGIYKVTPLKRGKATGAVEGGTGSAYGIYSFSFGSATLSQGNYSVAFGDHTSTGASSHNLVVCGKYNVSSNTDLFEIGNGSSSARSNILEANSTSVKINGDIQKNGVSLPTPYTTMPTITSDMLGQIAQYVGTTDSTYTQGYFYIAASDGQTEPTYSWVNLPTSPRTYSETVLFENDSMSPTSGTSNVTHTYTLSESIDNYDAVIVFVWGHCQMSNNVLTYNQGVPLLIPKSLYYLTGATAYPSWAFVANASISDASRRLCFSFTDSTHLFSEAVRTQSGVEPIVYKVIGIKY